MKRAAFLVLIVAAALGLAAALRPAASEQEARSPTAVSSTRARAQQPRCWRVKVKRDRKARTVKIWRTPVPAGPDGCRTEVTMRSLIRRAERTKAVRPGSPVRPKRVYADLIRNRDRGLGGREAFRATARRHLLAIAVVYAIAREGALRGWPVPPAPKLPRARILPFDRHASATKLAASPVCSETEPRKALAILRWRPAAERGAEQRIVVTIFRDFGSGTYESTARVARSRSRFEWHRVHGQAIHSWRVLTRQAGGWARSKTQQFTGPTCVFDSPAEEGEGGGPTP